MELKKFDKPMVVEELVFAVAPDKVEAYMDGDFTLFTRKMESIPGYMGCEIWVSADRPGYIRNIIFWEDMASMKAVDMGWIKQADTELKVLLGEENIRFVEESHAINQMMKVREFR